MTYTAIMAWDNDGRLAKRSDFSTQAEADTHIATHISDYPGAFVVLTPDGAEADWMIDGATRSVSIAPHPGTVNQVADERVRRLSFGFDYDFGDARGVHQIGTKESDMVGWRDVIDYANALIDSGDTTTLINIVTDTGPTQVTAPEWQAIILHSASIRQNIWAKSFVLLAMDPIPADYANDSYWT